MAADFFSSQDWRQNRKLETLGESLAGVRGELANQNRYLNAQLAKVRGSLEQRIDRLSTAFDAFVELSDVRAVLAMFTDSALVRHHARALVASIVERTDAPTTSPPDFPGYWLAPAVRVARARLTAGPGADVDVDLAGALRLDEVRASVFLTLVTLLAGVPGTGELDTALGEFHAGQPVTGAQRLLWQLCAAGRFGPVGHQLIEDRLRGMVAALTDIQRADADRQWRELADRQSTVTPAQQLAIPTDAAGIRDAALAAGQLAGLRALCQPGAPPQSSAVAPAQAAGPDAADPVLAEVTALLLTLVDEGTAEEAPLLHRAAQLRAIIEGRTQPDAPAWADDAAEAMQLLARDAFRPGSDGCGALARVVGAQWLLAVADGYLARVGTQPPDETRVRTAYRLDVRVRRVGPDSGDLATARSRIDAAFPDPRVPDPATVAMLVIGALAIGFAALFPAGFATLLVLMGFVLLIGVALRWRSGRRLRIDRRRERRVGHLDLDERTDRAQADLVTLAEQLPSWLRTARRDRDTIATALAPTPAAAR